MKNLTKMYIPFICGIFLMLSSCGGDINSTAKDIGNDVADKTQKLAEGAGELIAAPVFTNCDCDPLSGTTYQISAACAACMKANYVENGSKFPTVLDTLGKPAAVEGFKVDYEELNKIVGDGVGTKVYTMMGINTSDRGATLEPDIYHHVITAEGTTLYYDFTRPCPTYCPGD